MLYRQIFLAHSPTFALTSWTMTIDNVYSFYFLTFQTLDFYWFGVAALSGIIVMLVK